MSRETTAELSDDALMRAFSAGDPDAARMLTRRHLGRVLGYAARLLSDRTEAEDLAQEAMLRLWRQAPSWREGEARVSSWLYRVVGNLCIDHIRKRRPRRVSGLEDIAELQDPAAGGDARMMQASRMRALDAALAELPDRQRQALVLRHFEGMSNPEIAQILDVGVEAVESLTARAKKALAAALAGQISQLGYEEAG